MNEFRISLELSDLLENYPIGEGTINIDIETKKDGNTTEVWTYRIPYTELGVAVAMLFQMPPDTVYTPASEGQSTTLTLDKNWGAKPKPLYVKDGQAELAAISLEHSRLTWLLVLDRYKQLGWDPRDLIELDVGILEGLTPFVDLACAELELIKEIYKISKTKQFLNENLKKEMSSYEYWAATSHEWALEDYLHTISEFPKREKRNVWTYRSVQLKKELNSFEKDELAPFRFRLIHAARYLLNYTGSEYLEEREASRTFCQKAWNPYEKALLQFSTFIRGGLKIGRWKVTYRSPIIKGEVITTAEDPNGKYPITESSSPSKKKKKKEKYKSNLTKRGKYDRLKGHKNQADKGF
jgi:hypothetical protein